LVANYARKGFDLGLGSELYSYPTMRVFIENFALFLSLNFILWLALFSKTRISFATSVWAACANFYVVFAFEHDRHWYPANILFFIFFASYLKDWLELKRSFAWLKIYTFTILYLAASVVLFPKSVESLRANIELNTELGIHYENAALWMKKNIPAGETIYHNYWSDSAYFICFNPKNNYLVVLDPLYMYYRYPEAFLFYRDLSRGLINKPYEALKEVFKVNYGYTRKDNFFYARIKNNPGQFRILYEDGLGIVFELLKNTH
jgi:hypothetical protein